MTLLANDYLFIPLFGITIFVVTYMWSDRILHWLHKRSFGHREYVASKLDQMFIEVHPRKLTISMLLASFGTGSIIFLILWPNLIAGTLMFCIFVVLGWSIPKIVVDTIYSKRCAKFNDQMVDGLTIMSNGIRSGLTVPQAMERVVDSMGQPIAQEFGLVISQMRLGLSFEDSLKSLALRIPTPEVQMFTLSVNILRETGGNLAETFSTIVETIRERQKIERKIEALTAQGIMQGVIITLVPFFLLIVFLVIDPTYVRPLFTTTLGLVFLIIMLGLQLVGGLLIKNIVKIKV